MGWPEQPFSHVLFDCDSTLSGIEGVDELAALKGRRGEVEAITRRAMEGELEFGDALHQRLSVIRPNRSDLDVVGTLYVRNVVPGARELVALIQEQGLNAYIVSGGFVHSIQHLATHLGIPWHHVYANDLMFDATGQYERFNREHPTARSMGKALVAQQIPGPKVLFGDGASDLEARPFVDCMVGFCGVERRSVVEARADAVVYTANLLALAPFVFGRMFSRIRSRIRFDFSVLSVVYNDPNLQRTMSEVMAL